MHLAIAAGIELYMSYNKYTVSIVLSKQHMLGGHESLPHLGHASMPITPHAGTK